MIKFTCFIAFFSYACVKISFKKCFKVFQKAFFVVWHEKCMFFFGFSGEECAMAIGAFTTSIMGMNAQAHAMGQIGTNVANVSTTGYKKSETLFETKMTVYSNMRQDFNSFSAGVVDRRFVDISGQLTNTGSIYNLALDGQGFFVVNDGQNTFYTRAGDFEATTTTPKGMPPREITMWRPESVGRATQRGQVAYLKNAAGYYVMGWNADEQGQFTSPTLEPVVITPQDYYRGHASTNVVLKGNLDASADKTQLLSFPVYDNAYNAQSFRLTATPVGNADTWDIAAIVGNANGVTLSPPQVRFDANAQIVEPPDGKVTAQITWEDGSQSGITLDLKMVTQYANTSECSVLKQDGQAYGNFKTLSWDEDGVLSATYDNGAKISLCKVAVAKVTVPNNMEAISGNMFSYSRACGDLRIVDLAEADTSTSVAGNMLERSNVILEDEFSRMIVTQRAYSGNTKTFTTVNEMLQDTISIIS